MSVPGQVEVPPLAVVGRAVGVVKAAGVCGRIAVSESEVDRGPGFGRHRRAHPRCEGGHRADIGGIDTATDCLAESIACAAPNLILRRSLFCRTIIIDPIADRVKSSGFRPGWKM